ncbi:MAG: hypothetical protein AAGK32_01385 [Actinomycetota bacterium]
MTTDTSNLDDLQNPRRRGTGRHFGRSTTAGVGLLVSALVLLGCTGGNEQAIAEGEVAPPGAATPTGADADPGGVECYRSAAPGDLTAVFLIDGDDAWARTIPASGSGDDLVWAEGRRLDDETWLMYLRPERTLEVVPAVWERADGTLTTADAESLDLVDCDELTNPAVNERTGSDPVDLQLAEPVPVLPPGRHCYADNEDGDPTGGQIDLTVAADGAVTADLTTSTGDDTGPADAGSDGWFAADDTIVLETMPAAGSATTATWQLWQLDTGQSTATVVTDEGQVATWWSVDCSSR